MKSFCKSLVFLVATLALLGTLHATEEKIEEKIEEKAEVPVGYEEAAEPAKEEARKADAEEPAAEVPVGYEDAAKANKNKKRKRKRVVVPAMPAPVQDAKGLAKEDKLFAENAQLKAIAMQMRGQLKPHFAAELDFAKKVCRPDAKQLLKMKAQATPELKRAIRALAKEQGKQQGVFIAWRAGQQPSINILDQFETAASRIVADIFPDEVVKVYQNEQRHRMEFHAQAGALALAAHLDGIFRLSQSQREALTDSLQQVWQRSWQPYLQMMASNPQFFPPVPDDAVLPHLNKVQVKQWKATQRHNVGFGWQNFNNRGLFRKLKQKENWFEKVEEKEPVDGDVIIRIEAAIGEAVGGVVRVVVGAANEQEEDEEQEE